MSHSNEILIDDAFKEFKTVKSIEGLRDRTLKDHKDQHRYFNEFLSLRFPDIQYLSEITVSICRAYILYLKDEKCKWETHQHIKTHPEGLSNSTINIRLRALKAQYNFYAKEGYISSSPWEGIKLLKSDQKKLEVFSKEQFLKLLSIPNRKTFAGFRNYVLMITLLDTGLRMSELLSLKEHNIDLEGSIIWLGSSKAKVRSGRPIPISARTLHLIHDLMKENTVLPQWDGTLFISVSGLPLCDSSVRQFLKKYAGDAGIETVRVSPHTFRHTFGTHFILNGGDPFSLMKILGHSTIEMTKKYIQMHTEEIQKQHGQYAPLKVFELDKNTDKRRLKSRSIENPTS